MNLITILIPTFNRRTLLKRALNSIYRQTYTEFEIIVVDDGSTDGTEKMIRDLFPMVKYLSQPNKRC